MQMDTTHCRRNRGRLLRRVARNVDNFLANRTDGRAYASVASVYRRLYVYRMYCG